MEEVDNIILLSLRGIGACVDALCKRRIRLT
jgi:hypothetical protein